MALKVSDLAERTADTVRYCGRLGLLSDTARIDQRLAARGEH